MTRYFRISLSGLHHYSDFLFLPCANPNNHSCYKAVVYARFRELRLLPPTPERIERLIRLSLLDIRSNNEVHRPVIQALSVVKRCARTSLVYYPLDSAYQSLWNLPPGYERAGAY